MTSTSATPSSPAPERALCVDLDGTLVRTDLLYESTLALIALNPLYLLRLPFWLLRGKAVLKREVAARITLRPETLPYDERVVDLLRTTTQRPRVLCTASDSSLGAVVADHLGLFETVIASDGLRNLAGRCKADALVKRFGIRGFDYLGDSRVDLHVWSQAYAGWVVNGSKDLAFAARNVCKIREHWPTNVGRMNSWLKALRPHQWLKNLLVFVPLLAAHRLLETEATLNAVVAFVAFGLCASGVYLLNDLLDLTSDRLHQRKRLRPFAAGDLALLHGILAAPILAFAGLTLAWWCNPTFAAVLGVYYALTLGYSLRLKRIVMVDVILLASLYTIRIIGGAAAIGSDISFWLLAFSMFIFLSLAMLKRYTELLSMLSDGKTRASGRGYAVDDLPLLQTLGGSSGYIAVLVLALYINSQNGMNLYAHPKLLWLLCPLLLYWISRAWIVAHRGNMDDDPIVFAARDITSLGVLAISAIVIFAAI
ncbi:MAG: UbiA family prenyltransferase [Pseudomonas sp.]